MDISHTVYIVIRTRIFELAKGHYRSLSDLARAMELSVSQVYRVREGKRSINQKFIVGAKKAFPDCRLDELFYLDSGQLPGNMMEPTVTERKRVVQQVSRFEF